MRHFHRAVLLAAFAGLTTTAKGQLTPPRPSQPKLFRSFVGGGVVVTQPVGEFADNVGIGGGAVGTFWQNIDPGGILSIRADLAYLVYGHEHKQIPFPTAPRVQLDLDTYNSIVHGAVGPELRATSGAVSGYINGQVGFVHLFTESSLSGTDNTESFASTPNYGFTHISWVGSYGVLIALKTRAPVSIDVGAHYLYNGKARYLTPGDIHEDNTTGNVTITAHHSDANLIMYRVGVRVGVN